MTRLFSSPSHRFGWSYGPGSSRERWGIRCSAVCPTARCSHRRAVCSVAVSAIRRTGCAKKKVIRTSRRTSDETCQPRRAPCPPFESSTSSCVTKGARRRHPSLFLSPSLSVSLCLIHLSSSPPENVGPDLPSDVVGEYPKVSRFRTSAVLKRYSFTVRTMMSIVSRNNTRPPG